MRPFDDGGPAFPQTVAEIRGIATNSAEFGMPGMSLRDYFASKAMQAIFGGVGAQQVANRDLRYDETNWAEVVALNAYEMADAMLKVRVQQPEPTGK
jgi:hypothetical protein